MNYRIYCIFSKEVLSKMNGNRGKMIAQAGHAFLHSYWDALNRFPNDAIAYKSGLARKITLIVDTNEEIKSLEEKYKDICGVSLVIDAGLTVFKEPTLTCLGIGPIPENKIQEDLKSIKVLI